MKRFLAAVFFLSALVGCSNIEDQPKPWWEVYWRSESHIEFQKIYDNVNALFKLEKVSLADLENLWLLYLKAIEKIPLQSTTFEELSDISGLCFFYGNSVGFAAKKLLSERQEDSTKELLLFISARIVNFTRKLRDIITTRTGKTHADTVWLTVWYNDIRLNILNSINSIVFDDSNNADVTKYYLLEILMRLNESVDSNIYGNIVEEIAYDNPELFKKFSEKLQCLDEKSSDAAAKKFLEKIKSF